MITLVLALSLGQFDAARLAQLNTERNVANRDAMWVLNGWATANLIGGAAGWATADDPEWRAFHQMNFVWNLVNLGLGVSGIVQSYADVRGLDLKGSRDASQGMQISYLVNAGLDLVYLTIGAILLWRGNECGSPLLRGWGKAVLIQSVFLAIFDLALFSMHNTIGAPLRAGTTGL